MKPLSDKTHDTFEEVALEGAKHMKAFFAYEGDNPKYYQKAKVGAVAVNGFVKLRTSETARLAVELASSRQRAITGEHPKALKAS